MKQSYRDLVVWQRAIDMVPVIYALANRLPKSETYALADQLRRSVISIPANIAEGQGRMHAKEFRNFLSIAKGSLAELHTLLVVAERLKYLTPEELLAVENDIAGVARPLAGLLTRMQQ